MATIFNGDLKRELISAAGIQTARDQVPSQIAEKVVPVIETNPNLFRRINSHLTSSGAAAGLLTTSTEKDYYLVGCFLDASNKTASQDSIMTITAQIDGMAATQTIAQINFSTSALIDVGQANTFITYPTPLKIARGTSIAFTKTNVAVGRASIWGYYVENGNI
jgi:hypothetical protein